MSITLGPSVLWANHTVTELRLQESSWGLYFC
uniref:Uncharacterized protein n=1 Tax=Rhizophora mucronata TaxID=61149 RepID=A0A2P2LSY7_RHIMU